ncbi:MAG: hypothetical protein ACLTCN_07120 [Streptococcus salivarius]
MRDCEMKIGKILMVLSVLLYAYGADLLITGLIALVAIEGASIMYHALEKAVEERSRMRHSTRMM